MKIFKFTIIICIITLMSCHPNKKEAKIDFSKTDFIYLEGKKFKLHNKNFFPIMLNYVVCFRNIGNEYLLSPIKEYENPEIFESNTKESMETQIHAHLQLIKEMGFNSLRLVFDRVNQDSLKYYYQADGKKLFLKKDYELIFNALNTLLKIAKEKDLRIMLLIKAPVENQDLENFTIRLLEEFQDNPIIFAYDFFNEPLYFDNADKATDKMFREKIDAYKIVSKWKRMMQLYAKNQLFTIGFSEPIEVFEWDPSILPVDFVSFHTYNPLRVPNEIYWYSKYINKPWMIGETALPADGDSITYEEQGQFLKEVYQRLIDCGGSGLAWWEFQEIPNTHFEAQYTGLLNHKGITYTKEGNYKIIGTVKPAVLEIANFKNYKKQECKIMPNYYNMLGYNNFALCGKIINSSNGKPVEGAVIRGWNEYWSIGMNTFSNEKGEFTLYSNDECVRFEISAPGMTKLKFNFKTLYYPLTAKHFAQNSLPEQSLEYHNISYKSFLLHNQVPDSVDSDNHIFNFDATKFKQAKFKGSMGIKKLKPLNLN